MGGCVSRGDRGCVCCFAIWFSVAFENTKNKSQQPDASPSPNNYANFKAWGCVWFLRLGFRLFPKTRKTKSQTPDVPRSPNDSASFKVWVHVWFLRFGFPLFLQNTKNQIAKHFSNVLNEQPSHLPSMLRNCMVAIEFWPQDTLKNIFATISFGPCRGI